MTKFEIFNKIKGFIELKGFTCLFGRGDTFEDIGLDSLDFVEIIMECEEEFNISISDESAETIRKVDDLVNIIYDLIIPKEKRNYNKVNKCKKVLHISIEDAQCIRNALVIANINGEIFKKINNFLKQSKG